MRARVCLTWMFPWIRSMSSHFNARSSPWRIPVVKARTYIGLDSHRGFRNRWRAFWSPFSCSLTWFPGPCRVTRWVIHTQSFDSVFSLAWHQRWQQRKTDWLRPTFMECMLFPFSSSPKPSFLNLCNMPFAHIRHALDYFAKMLYLPTSK
jgi:hypothetical protein